MKAITLTNPWPWIIEHLGKRIENRTRNFVGDYRGPILIHAAKGGDASGEARSFVAANFGAELSARIPDRDALPFGAFVLRAELVHVIGPDWTLPDGFAPAPAWEHSQRRWYLGGIALVLENVEPVRHVQCGGKLGLWTPKPEDVALALGGAP